MIAVGVAVAASIAIIRSAEDWKPRGLIVKMKGDDLLWERECE